MGFPDSGKASTYADMFGGRPTSSGDIYSHNDYTAALLPRERWYDLPMGTHLRLTYQGRQIIVKVNDRGAGKTTKDKATGKRITVDDGRVLDLSRAAYAYLIGRAANTITDANAGVIQLEGILVVQPSTQLGPVSKSAQGGNP